MNEKIIRVLSATDREAAQNSVVWSHARKEYMPVDGSRSTLFHVELDGCYEQRTPENIQETSTHRSLNKYSEGTETVCNPSLQIALRSDDTVTENWSGMISRSSLYDRYIADIKQRRSASRTAFSCSSDPLQSALETAARLQALCSGERIVLEYYNDLPGQPWLEPIYTINCSTQVVSCIAFHPSRAEVFAVCYGGKASTNGSVAAKCDIFSLGDVSAPAFSLLLQAEATSVAWSPGSTHIVLGLKTGEISLFDAATGENIDNVHAHSDFVSGVEFARPGSFVSASFDGSFCRFDISRGRLQKIASQLVYADSGISFENESAITYAQDLNRDTSAMSNARFTVQMGQKQGQFDYSEEEIQRHPRPFRSTTICGARDPLTPYLLAAGAEDGGLEILSSTLGFSALITYSCHSLAVYGIAFCRFDEHIIASASEDQSVIIYHRSRSEPLLKIALSSAPVMVAFSPHRALDLLLVTHAGEILVFNVQSPAKPRFEKKVAEEGISFAAVNDKFKLLVIGAESGKIGTFELEIPKLEDTQGDDLQEFITKYGI